jgi:hypothetical protein
LGGFDVVGSCCDEFISLNNLLIISACKLGFPFENAANRLSGLSGATCPLDDACGAANPGK